MIMVLFDLLASWQYITKALAVPPWSCIGNKSGLRGRGHCAASSAIQIQKEIYCMAKKSL